MGFRINKQIAGFRKGKEFHYVSTVTLTKWEQSLIWLCVLLMVCGVLASLFVLKSVPAFVLSVAGGIILIFAVMMFCFFRKAHKEERQKNKAVWSETVNETWGILSDQSGDFQGQDVMMEREEQEK